MPRGIPSADKLIEAGVPVLKRYMDIDSKRTETLKELARIVVGIRANFKQPDGTPDWSGRTGEYREAISKLYKQAEVPTDSQAGIQSALRYHVGNELRRVAPTKELTAQGLSTVSPLEAQNARQSNPRTPNPSSPSGDATDAHSTQSGDANPAAWTPANATNPVLLIERATICVQAAMKLPDATAEAGMRHEVALALFQLSLTVEQAQAEVSTDEQPAAAPAPAKRRQTAKAAA